MIKRYRAAPYGGHQESPSGDMVLHTDHQELVSQLRLLLEQQMLFNRVMLSTNCRELVNAADAEIAAELIRAKGGIRGYILDASRVLSEALEATDGESDRAA